MAREVWPFRRAAASSIEFAPWLLTGVDSVLLPGFFEGWDPLTDIVIERTIRSDVAAIRSETGLGSDAPLVLSVSWINRQSFMTESAYRAPLDQDQKIRIALPASRLGGSITLRTTVAVASTDTSRPLGVARWAGSVLASHEQTLVLEGSGPMFPISEVDFAGSVYLPDASWALQLPDDLTLPVLGSVLLLINSRDNELVHALSASKPDPRQTALLETLEGQVGAFLIAAAASHRGELESEDWADQSVGELLASYLAIAEDHGVLKVLTGADPGIIAAAFDGAVRAEGFGRVFG